MKPCEFEDININEIYAIYITIFGKMLDITINNRTKPRLVCFNGKSKNPDWRNHQKNCVFKLTESEIMEHVVKETI